MKKYLWCYLTEKLHRYCFDKIYFNTSERKKRRLPVNRTIKERLIVWGYRRLFKRHPDFRIVLKHYGKNYIRYNLPDGINYK